MIHASFLKLSKPCSGPRTRHSFHPVRSKDGTTLIKDQQGILARWAEHLSELFNSINPHDPNFLDQLPQFPFISGLDAPPSLHEVTQAVKGSRTTRHPVLTASLQKYSSTTASTCFTGYRFILPGILSNSLNSGRMRTLSRSSSAKGIRQFVVIVEVFPFCLSQASSSHVLCFSGF